MFFILFMSLGLFVGISDMLGGYDRYIYGELFDSAADNIQNQGMNYMETQVSKFYSNETGFGLYNALLSYITLNRYIFIFITTIIAYLLIYKSMTIYCVNYQLATILFLALFFFFSFTYLRQLLSVVIGWYAIQFVYKRNIWKFLLFAFVAFSFHNSAILLVPLYFIPIRKYSTRTIVIISICALIIGITGIVGGMYENYTELMNDRRSLYANVESGLRIEYLIEAVVFLVLLVPFKKYIPDTPKNITLFNVAIMFCIVLLIFIKSVNGGRLGWFFAIGLISSISCLCQRMRRVPNYSLTTILLCFYLYFRILTGWGIMLYPYKTFFTNGHRENDLIYTLFEYDYNYDENKFYK
ncbi:MAG: EpsG family protein [Pseudoflavonifractor sp.]|nr:EpsG family protein [Pseudoflavonifractor sp.]